MDQHSHMPDDVRATAEHAMRLSAKIRNLRETLEETLDALEHQVSRRSGSWDLDTTIELYEMLGGIDAVRKTRVLRGTRFTPGQLRYAISQEGRRKRDGKRYLPPRGVYCVYVLIRHGVVVYVGYSSQVRQRLDRHRKLNPFDDYEVYECASKREARDLEAVLQQQHRPLRNVRTEARPA